MPRDPRSDQICTTSDQVRALKERVAELERLRDDMYAQLGGGGDPRQDPDHPGHMLIRLGWEYCPDEEGEPDYYGCFWRDPEAPRGKIEILPLNMALGIALKRMFRTRLERVCEDEDDF